MSREKFNVAEAETVESVEGNMLCTAMQGVTALPWSETPLRMKGKSSELGRPHLARTATRRCRATTGSRGDEAVEEEVRSRTAA